METDPRGLVLELDIGVKKKKETKELRIILKFLALGTVNCGGIY